MTESTPGRNLLLSCIPESARNTSIITMSRRLHIKRTPGGQTLLNLACGVYMHWDWNNVDFNPYSRLVRYCWLAPILKTLGLLSNKRYERLRRTDPAIISWDLRRGIPFPAGSFDMVYHSHFLEHLPNDLVPAFLKECRRVLRAGGTLRVVVPDLRYWAERYLESISRMGQGSGALEAHEKAVEDLIGQLVHREHSSTREQRPAIRFVERLVRGGTERTGELHRWMYDAFTLRKALAEAGFIHIQERTASSSRLPGWAAFCLDTAEDGSLRKPESLYLEAEKGS